jgi:hypothetical protein
MALAQAALLPEQLTNTREPEQLFSADYRIFQPFFIIFFIRIVEI